MQTHCKDRSVFGAARNIERGSLSIIATGLITQDHGWMNNEEFKGTGNSELILDRKLSDKNISAIDIASRAPERVVG